MRVGRRFDRDCRRAVVVGFAILLGIIGAGGRAARAAEDTRQGSAGLLDSVLETMNLKTKVGSTPDFVEATHPDASSLRFMPTGAPHPKRPTPVKSGGDIEAAKAALDAARDAQLAPKPALAPRPARKAAKSKQTASDN